MEPFNVARRQQASQLVGDNNNNTTAASSLELTDRALDGIVRNQLPLSLWQANFGKLDKSRPARALAKPERSERSPGLCITER